MAHTTLSIEGTPGQLTDVLNALQLDGEVTIDDLTINLSEQDDGYDEPTYYLRSEEN